MGKSSKTPSTTTQVVQSSSSLSPEGRQLFDTVFPTLSQFAAAPPTGYTGPTVAPYNAYQQAGANQLVGAAGTLQPGIDAALGAMRFGLSPEALFNSNPALRGAIDAAVRPLTENYNTAIMPQIRSNAVAAGQYGGSRQGVAEGIASRALLHQIGDTSSALSNEAFKTVMDTFQKSLALTPQTLQTAALPAQFISSVGTQQQQQQQAEYDAAQNQYYNNTMLPYQIAQNLAATAFGIPGGSGTTTTKAPTGVQQPSGLMSALGGAATGAGLATALGFSGPIGAGVGLLMSLL